MSALGCEVALMQAPLGRGAAAPLAIATLEPAAAIVERFAVALHVE